MQYRATISLEFAAFDQPELSRRQEDLAQWLDAFQQRFGPASLVIKERRPRRVPRVPAPTEVWVGR